MLTQTQAETLLAILKAAVRQNTFSWTAQRRHDETFVARGREDLRFILTLSRNPFEIRLHLRTKRDNIGLMRVDGAPYHTNPDGTELHHTPHLHLYREGSGLAWAEAIDWYDPDDPAGTLLAFLEKARACFPGGIQVTLD